LKFFILATHRLPRSFRGPRHPCSTP
jgi:hypothetical protein